MKTYILLALMMFTAGFVNAKSPLDCKAGKTGTENTKYDYLANIRKPQQPTNLQATGGVDVGGAGPSKKKLSDY